MKRLTRAEEEIMHIIWEIAPCTVADIRNYIEHQLGQERPPHSTISTLVRILDDKKAFLTHRAFGRTFEYTPTITKAEYSRQRLQKLVGDYFEGSMHGMVSFLVREKDLSTKELEALLDRLNQEEE
ncbi:MAG: BlaI/MecI/CopY family transcriptional regulator [Saprospiraceae bacterium]|nr:BlaI/MecI/CopY family transcriptional regulator [Saprospiraceae bacterium]